MSSDIAISVRNLSKCYRIYDRPQDRFNEMIVPRLQKAMGMKPHHYGREFWALKDVSFEVKKGETFGIIGKNGSGKSTLLQLIAGILEPTSGDINVNGRIAALLELGSGFNPEFSGKENVFLNAGILGLTQKETETRYQKIIEFADIGDFIDQPVKTYSSGMMVRLAFAVQASVDASIVIIDEALAVGDIFFRQKCYARLEELKNSGAAILLVSHAMPEIEQYCNKALVVDHGRPHFIGAASEATKRYYLLNQVMTEKSSRAKLIKDPDEVVAIKRPKAEAYLNLSAKSQISNGQAMCIGVSLCDEWGEPCNSFRQGEKAFFYYEFEILDEIDIPICGLTLSNERGVIIHGKNSLQSSGEVSLTYGVGSIVGCHQEVTLDIAPGQYTFQVGLASISHIQWKNRRNLNSDELDLFILRICHIPHVGTFSVGVSAVEGVGYLRHHGVANLPGAIKITAGSKLGLDEVN